MARSRSTSTASQPSGHVARRTAPARKVGRAAVPREAVAGASSGGAATKTSTGTSTGARSGRAEAQGRSGLTRERIIATATAMIDRDGADSVSMRKLGAELGVEAMALYHHFPDREAILDAVVDAVLSMLVLPPRKTRWSDRLTAILTEARKTASAHPHLFRLMLTRRNKPASALPMMEAILEALSDAGVAPDKLPAAYHTLMVYFRGFLMMETEHVTGCLPALPSAEQLAAFPHIRAVRDRLYPEPSASRGAAQLDALWGSGLRLILDAVSRG